MIVLIFCTDQFSTSLAGLWVCSNERAPTTPLQQSIRGIIELPPYYPGVRACTHSMVPGFIYLSFVCTLCHHLLCRFFLLLFLTWTFTNILTFNTPCAGCYFFFLTKGIPSHLAIDSLTHTPQKFGYAKPSWNSCCTHDIPSTLLSPSFGLFFSHLFPFFFGSRFYPLIFPSRFFNYQKKKICSI
jgi:hypothetical protein